MQGGWAGQGKTGSARASDTTPAPVSTQTLPGRGMPLVLAWSRICSVAMESEEAKMAPSARLLEKRPSPSSKSTAPRV